MPLKTILLFLFLSILLDVTAQKIKLIVPIGHTEEILTMSVSPDGKYLFSGSRDKNGIIWDLQSGKEVFRQTSHSKMIYASDIDSSNSLVATGAWDGTIQVWNFKTSSHLNTFRMEDINDCKFNPVNNSVIAFATSLDLIIWNYKTNTLDTIAYNQQGGFTSISFSSDGLYLAAGNWRGDIIIWNTKTKNLDHTFEFASQSRVIDIAFRPGTYQLTAITPDRIITQFDVASKSIASTVVYPSKKVKPIKEYSISYNRLGSLLAIGSSDDDGGSFCIIDADKWQPLLYKQGNLALIKAVVFNPTNNNLFVGTTNGFIGVWDIVQGIRLKKLEGKANRINDIAFSPDSRRLALADNFSIKFLDINKGVVLERFTSDEKEVESVDYSPDGKYLVSSHEDSILFWNLSSNQIAKGFYDETLTPLNKLRYSKKGDRLLALSKTNGWVKVKDIQTMEDIHRGAASILDDATLSDDGKLLGYAGDFNLNKYQASIEKLPPSSNAVLADLFVHTKELYNTVSVAFDKISSRIIISTQTRIGVWDLKTGVMTDSLERKAPEISKAIFSLNGEKVLITTFNGKFIIWDILKKNTQEISFQDPLNDIFLSGDDNHIVLKSNFGVYFLSALDFSFRYKIYLINDEAFFQTPEGYYMSSPDATKHLHYVTKDLKFITFEQLDVKYNRPDKVLEAIWSNDTALIRSYRKAYEKRIKKLGIDTTAFRDGYSVPEADFANRDNIEFEQKDGKLNLNIKSIDSTYKLDRFNVWVNESPVYGQRGISIRKQSRNNFDSTITINLSQGENKIETSITNVNGTESYRMPLLVNYTPADLQKSKTYFIGIGIDEFAQSKYNLKYSTKDIRDLSKKLKEKYKDIIIDTLFNEDVTINKVKALKQKLLQTSVNDKVIISYSGHGMLSKQFDYYLSTYAVNFDKPEENGLPYDELESLLDSIPARKKLMLIDACHSGEVDKDDLIALNATDKKLIKGLKPVAYKTSGHLGLKNSFELMQSLFVNVGKSTGATIISAAAGTEFALEGIDNLPNGVFTYSILEAMNKYPSMKISELKKIVGERVVQLTNGLQKPTSRNETVAVDWNIW